MKLESTSETTLDEIVHIAYDIKRNKGVSWTKMPQALYEAAGVQFPTHQIRDAIRVYEKVNNLNPKESRSVALMISDVHVGKKTVSFDFNKLKERMTYMFNELIDQVKQMKRISTVEDINLCFIGDIIDNDSLYPTQPHHVDHENAGHATLQIKLAAKFFEEEIRRVQKACKIPIIIHAVKGNHGRISKFTNESNNYDLMFYNHLELAFERSKSITCRISHGFYALATIQNHNFLLNHGNGIKMYQNIPWYGLVQRTMRWEGSLPYQFDYVVVGHFHTTGEQQWNNKVIYMNGTAVTDDDFGLEVLGLSASNKFWLFGVNQNNGICYQHKIDLSEV